MLLDLHIGDRVIRPSENEQALAAAGAGALGLGLVLKIGYLKLVGLAALAAAAYSVYEEAQLFTAPETMNAHFLTDGRLSAMNGPTQAAQLAGVFRTGDAASSRSGAGGSYGPGPRGRG